jgi:hypothetical protein
MTAIVFFMGALAGIALICGLAGIACAMTVPPVAPDAALLALEPAINAKAAQMSAALRAFAAEEAEFKDKENRGLSCAAAMRVDMLEQLSDRETAGT